MQSLAAIMLFGLPSGSEWIIILVVVLLLFGGKKIPELMKGIGKGVRGFKDGLKEIEDDIKTEEPGTK
ncbi:MAG: twin-arginine translocase TatA/TatE family subunit [Dysgonamonadaceae bacterium]|nr:twin-arginine translocase TatA/TatE family subunit [Dysgonamonadaceae bacterium]